MELPECEHPIPTMGAPPPEKVEADWPPIPLEEPDDEEDDETVPPGLVVDPGLEPVDPELEPNDDPELEPNDDPEPRLNPEELWDPERPDPLEEPKPVEPDAPPTVAPC
jgi:hypothetical protein